MDFDRWMQEQPKALAATPQEDLESLGFSVLGDGTVVGRCCMCKRDIRLTDYVSAKECLDENPDKQYCGGSPRCCP